MANDLEKQSTDTPEDFLPYVFTEDAISEGDAFESVGQEDLPSGIVLIAPRTGMSALSFGDALAEALLANAKWKMPFVKAHSNQRIGV